MQKGRNDAGEKKALPRSPGSGPGWDAEPEKKSLVVIFGWARGAIEKMQIRRFCVQLM